MKDNKFHLGTVKFRYNKLKQQLPKKVADESRSFFMKGFRDGGFNQDGIVEKWQEVDRRKPDKNAYKYPKQKGLSRRTKPILVRTGRLRNSIRITSISFGRSVIRSDVPYARYHNQGTKYIKKRKFIGRSKYLDRRVIKMINREINKLF